MLTIEYMTRFRFHTGSIKSHDYLKYIVPSRQFRFHTGSIKSCEESCHRRCIASVVSIPYWFD